VTAPAQTVEPLQTARTPRKPPRVGPLQAAQPGPVQTARARTPERHDDPAADVAYLDADTGSIEWQANAPTYVVVTEDSRHHDSVIALSERRR
jgi:hypothetical protein